MISVINQAKYEDEEMILLSKKDIDSVVNINDIIEAVKKAFSLINLNKITTPLRTSISGKNGNTFLFMPSFSAELNYAAIKNINVAPKNPDRGLPACPAQISLIDGDTGMVCSVMDGTYVTQLRTGAASGAAIDILGKKKCIKGAVIGTGGQAESQIDSMIAARKLQQISVFSRDPIKRKAFADKMTEKHSTSGIDFVAAENSDECIEDADLIICVTNSATPVFDAAKVKNGATICCIGTYQPDKHEMDPLILKRASKIFCDSKDAVLGESGDLIIPLSEGIITENDITGNLGEVINGTIKGRENDSEIIVFESVGIGAQDLLSAITIYKKAVDGNIGTMCDL